MKAEAETTVRQLQPGAQEQQKGTEAWTDHPHRACRNGLALKHLDPRLQNCKRVNSGF